MGGRLVLLRSVLSAIPVFYLSLFRAPSGIIYKLESLFMQFLWGGSEKSSRINWVKWSKVCKDKDKGGLGVKNIRDFNSALLESGCGEWRLRTEKDSLCTKFSSVNMGRRKGE
jgi:hypothetical protein